MGNIFNLELFYCVLPHPELLHFTRRRFGKLLREHDVLGNLVVGDL